MTQLLMIATKTYMESTNNIGDIVGRYPDTWKFTPKEIAAFDIIKVADSTEDIDAIVPDIKRLTKSATTDWTEQEVQKKFVWQGEDKQYRDVVIEPKYKLCLENGVIKETYSKSPENLTTIAIASKVE